eukprot:augustus_masked-scaffold_95-processed-gene-0.32-mRNA-1 protein AED:0.61 eAED:0.61 QI:0/0/0/0.33/1/1/3/0/438
MSKIPREIIHVDSLSVNNSCKIIVLVDNATRNVFMKVVEKEDAENMALALIEFLGNFQFENNFTLVTDNVSYFAGKLLQTFSEVYHFKQYFSIKFSPWTNGVVEITNAKIVRIIRTLCSQFRLNVTEVHKLVGTIMDSLNNYPSRSKANFTPNQPFMNAPPTSSNTLLENISGLASALSIKLTKRNRTSIESNFHEVRKLMHERLKLAYNTTMEIRVRKTRDIMTGSEVLQYNTARATGYCFRKLQQKLRRMMCEDLSSLSEDFILEYKGKNKKSVKQTWESINSKSDTRVGHIGVFGQAVPTSSPGWLPEEKEVLRSALQEQGFKFRNLITWVKTTKNDKLAVGNGHIFRHATEKCILATEGNHSDLLLGHANDVILLKGFSQSQKPVEIYELAETLLPGKQYLDLFSRSCNLRYRWFSAGLELITNYRKFIFEKEE